MNITFINRLMGIRFGGGENVDVNLASKLQKKGHRVRILTGIRMFGSFHEVAIDNKEVEIIYVRTPYLRGITYSLNAYDNYFINKIASAFREIDMLCFNIIAWIYLRKDNWTDIYQVLTLPKLGVWLKSRGKRVVVRFPGPPSPKALRYAEKCDAFFANGNAYSQILASGHKNVKFINIGVDTDKFAPGSKNEKGKIFTFLFVGRIIPLKNIPFLINGFLEAKRINRNMRLVIVGDGELRELDKMNRLIDQHGLRDSIVMKGKKYGKELVAEYQNADCFVLSSNYDNFPNVVIEAMACGLPVVATRVGGVSEQVIQNRNGLLISPGNVFELKEAMTLISLEPGLAEKMGAESRNMVHEKFSWSRSADELEKLYNQFT